MRRPPQFGSGADDVVPVDLGPGQLQVAERDVDVLLDVRRAGLEQQDADVRVLREARGEHAPGRARSDDHVVVHRTSSSVGPIPLGTLAPERTPHSAAAPNYSRPRCLDERPDPRARALDRGGARGGVPQPASVAFVTVGEGGRPSARTVTLKRIEDDALLFTSALWTRKAQEIEANPQVALLFHWPALGRQVHVTGEAALAERALAGEVDLAAEGRPVYAQGNLGVGLDLPRLAGPESRGEEQGFVLDPLQGHGAGRGVSLLPPR